MRDDAKFYIDGAWLDATGLPTLNVINPATEKVAGRIALGTAADVDHAVAAAKAAFRSFSRTTRALKTGGR
jgi:aldehyde dehydrogenase (NAD+)